MLVHTKMGCTVPNGEILIAKEVERVFGYKLTKGKLSEIIAHVKRRTYHKNEELDADINIINLKNGLYDINEDILLPHTPAYLSTNQKFDFGVLFLSSNISLLTLDNTFFCWMKSKKELYIDNIVQVYR